MFIHQYLLVMTKHLLALYGLLLFAALRLDAQSREKTIMFFGNSLTAGYGLEPSQSFPSLIQEMLYEEGANYRVINAGLSGETSAGGLNRIDWVLNQEVDIFVLELGANDGLRGLPLESTKQNLQGIIAKLFEKYPSAKLVLAGMMVPPNMGDEYGRDFVQIYPALAEANNCALIPFLLRGVAGDPDLNLPDGIHPNVEGQKIVAENVWKVLIQLL
jgi:acyl-CoA thioesterase-1